MSQQEVIDVLKKFCGKEFTSTEISKILNKDTNVAIRVAIRQLLKDFDLNLQVRLLSLDEKIEKFGKVVNPKIYVYWIED